MRWQEVVVQTGHDAVEAISNYLHELGAGGVVIEDPIILQQYTASGQWDYYDIPVEQLEAEHVNIKGYLPVDTQLPYRLEGLKAFMTILQSKLPQCHFEVILKQVDEEDWANSWKVYYKPTEISKGLVIVPSWEEYQPRENEEIILLDPGMAFGTGTHQTTRLCVQLLNKVINGGEVVFDVGTGSGILALAAAKLGADKVYASDIDRTAVEIAQGNMKLNKVDDKVTVETGYLLEPLAKYQSPQIILANIVADVILLLAPSAFQLLNESGYLVVSGIIRSRRDEVKAGLIKAGFALQQEETEGEWVALLAKKEQ